MTIQIELMADAYIWKHGERLAVVSVVPHGGYYDDRCQYVVRHQDQMIYIRSGLAREVHF